MTDDISARSCDTVVIGGGQAGLAMGYHLRQRHRDFVILDAGERVGEAWRKRWDSLRLFSPAAFSALPGMPFPAPGNYLPSKDEIADYLEEYASRFDLPVRLGQPVRSVSRSGDTFAVYVGDAEYRADNVVVATGPYSTPRLPAFAQHLDPARTQLHSSAYRHPDQMPPGEVLVVGAGNSGAEISLDLSATHRVYLSGRETGSLPLNFRDTDHLPRPLVAAMTPVWWLIDRVLTVDTRAGRKYQERIREGTTPLIRASPHRIRRAGVERVPRVTGVVDGSPLLADGRVLRVPAVVWATGFATDYGWIDLPILDQNGYPRHRRGAATDAPGLYFLGLPFQYTITSGVIGGVGKDARYIADQLPVTGPQKDRSPAAVPNRQAVIGEPEGPAMPHDHAEAGTDHDHGGDQLIT